MKNKNYYILIFSLILSFLLVEIFLKIYKFPLSGAWRIQDNDGLYLNKTSGQSKHQFKGNKEFISVKYKFGEYHNRIYDDFPANQKDKILVLGDSFTFGWLLNDQDTFIYKLQENFTDKHFINSAAGGWGFDDYARFLENYCNKINPKKILIFISNVSNDLDDARLSNLYEFKNGKLLKSQNKIHKFKKKLNGNITYQFILENISIFQLVRFLYVTNHHFIKEKKMRNKLEEKEIKKKLEIKKQLLNKRDNIYINLIFEEIIKNVELCRSELYVFNLAWDTGQKNKLDDKLENISKLKINLYDFYETNQELWKNKKKYKLEEGHPNKLANAYFFNKIILPLKNELK